jgi:hypothetical protein
MGRLKGTVYARMEEMSFRSGAAVALGLLRYRHPSRAGRTDHVRLS